MDVLKQFGIEPGLLIAQIFNFALLLILLNWLLYKPVQKMLQDRKNKIESGIKNAEEIEKRLASIAQEREQAIRDASKEAERIINEAGKNAQDIITAAHTKAAQDIEKLSLKHKQEMETEKLEMYEQMRQKLADLVILSFQKVAGKILTDKDQKDLIETSLKEINK